VGRASSIGATLPVARAALFLDLDGAIVPIAADPAAIKASPVCRIVLHRAVEQLCGRLAILSGRTIEVVDQILGGAVQCVAGVHGLQRRTPVGGMVLEPTNARVADATTVLEVLAKAEPGLIVEPKGPSVAIHYRAAPAAAAAVIEVVERLALASGLEVQHGKMVAELRTPGPDKGAALDRFMLEAPFTGAKPIFIGDDLTDEAGFAAAQSHGGVGILVGERRMSLARGRLESPEAVLSWIMRSLDANRFDLRDIDLAA
jgi:trehalose 6-phosphate phosphatase